MTIWTGDCYRPARLTPQHVANMPPAGQEMPRWMPIALVIVVAVVLITILKVIDLAICTVMGCGR